MAACLLLEIWCWATRAGDSWRWPIPVHFSKRRVNVLPYLKKILNLLAKIIDNTTGQTIPWGKTQDLRTPKLKLKKHRLTKQQFSTIREKTS
jgi:hypothetical protein